MSEQRAHEHELSGGNASGTVVRIEGTVRKPSTDATAHVHRFMQAIRAYGVDVPATFGRDEQGRQIIEFVPGQLALEADPLTRLQLHRVGAMVREIHDASAGFTPDHDAFWQTAIPTPGNELVCHNDLAPWNLIIGERWVFIDWDAAAPSTRLWDLAYSAQAFALSNVRKPPVEAARDLAAFVDGYGAERALRIALPAAMLRRTEAMLHLLSSSHEAGREPWASMFAEGHGAHWQAATQYVGAHQALWSAAPRHE